jgi:hypothetical protein
MVKAVCVVLSAFTNNVDPSHLPQAERLLNLIEDLLISWSSEPVDNHAYNMILDAYDLAPGVCRKKERVQATIQHMKEQSKTYGEPSLMSDKVSNTALSGAIIADGKPNFCEQVADVVLMMEFEH